MFDENVEDDFYRNSVEIWPTFAKEKKIIMISIEIL